MEPVPLPCLRTLRLIHPSIYRYSGQVQLPVLETLILLGVRFVGAVDLKPISVPSVTSIISTRYLDVRVLQRISAPSLYHLDIRAQYLPA